MKTNNRILRGLTATLLAAGLAFGSPSYAEVCEDCDNPATLTGSLSVFAIELVSIDLDGDLATFNYEVCFVGPGPMVNPPPPAPDLSHWAITLEDCLIGAVVGASLNGVPLVLNGTNGYEIGTDPTTGISGIKFDVGFDRDDGCAEYSVTFDTTLIEDGYTVGFGCVLAATKAGREDVRNAEGDEQPGIGCILGPVCISVNDDEPLWIGETAWSAGTRYVTRGNWATYTSYESDNSVILYAGQNMDAGTVHFSACVDDQVTITILLNPGWRFALDAEDNPVVGNLKIQGYDATPPAANPAPGQFTTSKTTESGMSASVTVPCYDFYGIHADVEWLY